MSDNVRVFERLIAEEEEHPASGDGDPALKKLVHLSCSMLREAGMERDISSVLQTAQLILDEYDIHLEGQRDAELMPT